MPTPGSVQWMCPRIALAFNRYSMDILLKPFTYEFFRNGALAAVMLGGVCGVLGVLIVLRGMSYIGHGLSHAIFGGAAVALARGWNYYIAAGLWGFVSALLINQTVRRLRISADAAIGIVTTASFALGVAVISGMHRFTRNIEAVLFGSILGVQRDDLLAIFVVAVGVFVTIGLFYRPLLFTTFDDETAGAFGVRTAWIDTLLSLMLAFAIIVAMNVIGVTLIAATIVIPPITARLLTERFDRMLLLSAVLGASTSLIGIYLSYYLDTSSGATIVLTQTACFVLSVGFAARRSQGHFTLPRFGG